MEMDDETEARIVEKVEYIGEAMTVLSTETAEAMQEAAQFRNVLAHTYGHDIDDKRVYSTLPSVNCHSKLSPSPGIPSASPTP